MYTWNTVLNDLKRNSGTSCSCALSLPHFSWKLAALHARYLSLLPMRNALC